MAVKHYDWLAHHANTAPEQLAAVDLRSGRRYNYAQYNERVRRLAAFLITDLGVSRGDRVAILAHNSTDCLEVQFACAKIGAIFVPLNWRLTVPELEFILSDAAPTVLIHDIVFETEAAQLQGLMQPIPSAGNRRCRW